MEQQQECQEGECRRGHGGQAQGGGSRRQSCFGFAADTVSVKCDRERTRGQPLQHAGAEETPQEARGPRFLPCWPHFPCQPWPKFIVTRLLFPPTWAHTPADSEEPSPPWGPVFIVEIPKYHLHERQMSPPGHTPACGQARSVRRRASRQGLQVGGGTAAPAPGALKQHAWKTCVKLH